MEENMKKNIYIITESLCYTAEIKHNIVNQLYFNKFFLKVPLKVLIFPNSEGVSMLT